MKLSKLFTKTLRESPKDEESINAKLLIRGGFIEKNSAGVFTFLPLGLRVLEKLVKIVKREMNAIGGLELLMPALVEKKYWEASGRWDVEIGYEVKGKKEEKANFILGWSHEDILSDFAKRFINSYKDLPQAVYQVQTKFRDEPRVKSGLLRGREFLMKDLYSFHESEENFSKYYDVVKEAYFKIFKICGLDAIYTLAGGGVFTSGNTNEFQILSLIGEDTIFFCPKCGYAENKEISELKEGGKCLKCGGEIKKEKSIEVGNIFPLGTKYSEAVNLNFIDRKGNKKFVVMGSYGIGISRLMGTIVEVHNDEKGIIWPESAAPFKIHLIALDGKNKEADEVYDDLMKNSIEVLYDDREEQSAGEKFADADLIGCPIRAVISEKTLENDSAELKNRNESKIQLLKLTNLADKIR